MKICCERNRLTQCILQSNTRAFLDQLDILPNSEAVLAQHESQENNWTLYDIYKVAYNHTLEMSVLAWINGKTNGETWSLAFGVRTNGKFHRTAIRKNLNGLRLRCGFLVSVILARLNFEHLFQSNDFGD